ncbi:sialin-like isoform X2 [Zootermopsis nevadensis]|uniref:sialin-like isoform X2 n=1 Tax=Zootermopsis nevadensis TaxID=136037 RepID=UPI000B8ECFC2|nr:sialin-like isoform X2 [Zootermopsis nevadensis]
MAIADLALKDAVASSEGRKDVGTENTPRRRTDDGLGPSWHFWKRRRHVVALLAFFGFFGVYALRVNLSVAIVAMTSPRKETLKNGTTIFITDFDWDSKTQGLVLSSFFYGYIVTQVLGGWLAGRLGGNTVYGVGVAATAVFTLLTPVLTNTSVYLLVAVRVIEGLFEGVTYPCMHAVWSRWAPPLERSHLAGFAGSGSYVGTVIALPLSGLLASNFGWPSIFYVFGIVVMIWFFIWCKVVKSGPEEDPNISPEELKYIQDSMGNIPHKDVKHPWGKFLTSPAVWAIVVAHFSENWGFYTLLTQLPIFMKDVLHFKLEKSGLMSAVPYLVMAIVLQFSGRLADCLLVRRILTTTQVRKMFTCVAYLSQTIFMLLAAFLLTPAGAVTCISIAVGLGGFALAGFL